MSLINTNEDYLSTMGLPEESPIVGLIVALYYLGTAVGAVIFSYLADRFGRKPALFGCLAMSSLGNLIMFVAGLKFSKGAIIVMIAGRVVMGLGVGGVDAVVPVYSSELSEDEARGKALAQEFQMNIFGLNMAFAVNLGLTIALGKSNQWAWRLPIIIMQVYPVLLMAFIGILPESPRWLVSHDRKDDAKAALVKIYGEDQAGETLDNLIESNDNESSKNVTYTDMLTPGHAQFHPTMITVMGQINQALTGYGAVSVYGPQIFELLGFDTRMSEYLTQGNYVSYFILMTFAWLLVDAVGRRKVLLGGSIVLTVCFFLLTLFGGLAFNADDLGIPEVAVAVPGIVALYVATGAFGIGWLATIWVSSAMKHDFRPNILTIVVDSHGNLPYYRKSPRYCRQRRRLGFGQLCRHPPDTHPLQQSQLLALPRLRILEHVRWSLDLLLPARVWWSQLRRQPGLLRRSQEGWHLESWCRQGW